MAQEASLYLPQFYCFLSRVMFTARHFCLNNFFSQTFFLAVLEPSCLFLTSIFSIIFIDIHVKGTMRKAVVRFPNDICYFLYNQEDAVDVDEMVIEL